jgi:hypothetical protein
VARSKILDIARVDFKPSGRRPSITRIALATVIALVGSLLADALIVAVTEAIFPSTKGYEHFQLGDYANLTIIGVVIACLGWPIINRVSSAPRWIYARLAVLVTIVLLLPDLWLLHQGQPTKAVAGLMIMHLAIAVVTYYAVTLIAAEDAEA